MSLASFGVRRPVVPTLVMWAIVAAGLLFGVSLRREFFPETPAREVVISAPYPGAAPDEVERALAVKIEDSLKSLDDVKEITTTVSEGAAAVRVEFNEGVDIVEKVAEIKREVDALQDLPDAADRIVVRDIKPALPAIIASVYGDADQRVLKDFILSVRDDLESLEGMGELQFSGLRADEIVVEVRPEALLRYGLSITDVADRIGVSMRELPGGSVRASTQTVSLRAMGIDERAEAVRAIVVAAPQGGTPVLLQDVAEVREGFIDADVRERLNGKPSASVTILKEKNDDIVDVADMVKAYVAGRNGEPYEPSWWERVRAIRSGGVVDASALDSPRARAWSLGHERSLRETVPGTFTTTTDLARFVVGRLDLLTRNALTGGIAVFVLLLIFMNWRAAVWVLSGLVISILGTLAVMAFFNVTLNLLTMFGLIIVLGILVDDAIVVAENISTRHEQGEPALVAAVRGTDEVAWPVVGTVLTTIFAFLPLALIQGRIGDFLQWLPIVVACALAVSLVESLFILPMHMGHSLRKIDRTHQGRSRLSRFSTAVDRFQERIFDGFVGPAYMSVLRPAIRFRYITTAIAVSGVLVCLGLVARGTPEFIFFETDDAETVNASLTMPVGTPADRTDDMVRRIEAVALAQPEVKSAFAISGAVGDLNGEGGDAFATNLGQVILELKPVEERTAQGLRSSDRLIQAIRDELGELPGIESLRMEGVAGGPGGSALAYTIVADEPERIDAVVSVLKARMGEFDGVVDITDDANLGQRELRIDLLDGAAELGFTRASLGRQIQAFAFGLEAYTFAGDREDVDVRVMLPVEVRRSVAAIESMHVFTPAGVPVPLKEVARLTESRGYATIRRLDGLRAVTVSADVDRARNNPDSVAASVEAGFPAIEAEHPGVRIRKSGRQQDNAESFATLPVGAAVAAGLIYITLAWLFGSFTQPLIVMMAIPFAVIGMILGHLILGYSMTFLSLIGFVALAGIVVNDSLVYMQFFNAQRRRGQSVLDAALAAGRARVRAIILTTVTTVAGLAPLILEQSLQARFLIPMAITIAAGLISATLLVLIVLPCMLRIFDDISHTARVLWSGDLSLPRRNPFLADAELELLDAPSPDARNTDAPAAARPAPHA